MYSQQVPRIEYINIRDNRHHSTLYVTRICSDYKCNFNTLDQHIPVTLIPLPLIPTESSKVLSSIPVLPSFSKEESTLKRLEFLETVPVLHQECIFPRLTEKLLGTEAQAGILSIV
jgi:hypothetical protein